jgi:dipeptidyl aminopeptidase/acylaminoacyl peptidase
MEIEDRMKMTVTHCWEVAVLFAGIMLLLAPAVLAQSAADAPKPDAAKKNRWTAEDVVYQEDAGQFRISPDGKFALWVKGTADKEKDLRVSNLYLSNLNDGKEVQLTRETDEVSQPRWSPSGEMIAYMSTHALPKPKPDLAPTQLWLLNAAGGEPWAVTEFERGIQQFEWLDNDTVVLSAEEDTTL